MKNLFPESHKPKFSYILQYILFATFGSILTTLLALVVLWFISQHASVDIYLSFALKLLSLSIVFGALISVIIYRKFIAPLIELGKAMEKISGGNFDAKLKCSSRLTEVNKLYRHFNTMVTELSKIDTIQTDFISNVSHEFKTPLSAIEGYASLLQDSQLTAEMKDQYVEKIIYNTRRLSELVGNILLLNKVSNGSSSPKVSTYRLDEQIRQSILALEAKWTEREIDFDVDLPECEYTGCEILLGHVWTNLIDNAVKFSNQGGEISIRLTESDGGLIFSIHNYGEIIPAGEIRQVFNRFYQSEGSRKNEGSGLGLALVKTIINKCHGSISVQSSQETGTEFRVALPRNNKAA